MRELIQYIARFRPHYPKAVRGATPEQVGRLTDLVGRPLPSTYRDFLTTLGQDMGDFVPFDPPKDFAIDVVIRYYQKRPSLSKQFLFIALDQGPACMDLLLEDLGPTHEPQVVQFYTDPEPDPSSQMILYESLADMLFSLAFAQVRLPMFPHQAGLASPQDADVKSRPSRPRPEQFVQLARQMGFERVPHTGSWSPCFDRGNAAILCFQPPTMGTYVGVGADTETEANRLAEILSDHLALIRTE